MSYDVRRITIRSSDTFDFTFHCVDRRQTQTEPLYNHLALFESDTSSPAAIWSGQAPARCSQWDSVALYVCRWPVR